jgi:hypothetical protein
MCYAWRMSNTPPTNPPLGFEIMIEDRPNFDTQMLRVDAELVRVSDRSSPIQVRSISDYYEDDPDWGLAGLCLGTQLTGSAALEGDHLRWYRGVEFRFPHDAITRYRAASIVSAYRRIDHRLTSLESRFGAPETWVELLLRVSDILRVSRFVVRNSKSQEDVTGEVWRLLDADGVRALVAKARLDFIARLKSAAARAV